MKQPNQPPSPWQIWSYEVEQKLKAQQNQIEKLECQVAELCSGMKQLESRPTYNIESIAYHFDQLKIEKLEGTLNIGMTAPTAAAGGGIGGDNGNNDLTFPANIDQFSVNDLRQYPSASPAIKPPEAPYEDIMIRMNQYLDKEAVQKMLNYESELCLSIDTHHRRIIIEDIRKQLPTRVHYYLQQLLQNDENKNLAMYNDLVTDRVVAKTSRDADSALLTYLRQLQLKNHSSGGSN